MPMLFLPVSNRTFAGIFPFVRRAEEVVGEIFEAGKLFEFVVGYVADDTIRIGQ